MFSSAELVWNIWMEWRATEYGILWALFKTDTKKAMQVS